MKFVHVKKALSLLDRLHLFTMVYTTEKLLTQEKWFFINPPFLKEFSELFADFLYQYFNNCLESANFP